MNKIRHFERTYAFVIIGGLVAVLGIWSHPIELLSEQMSAIQAMVVMCLLWPLLVVIAMYWKRLIVRARICLEKDQQVTVRTWLLLAAISITFFILAVGAIAVLDVLVLALSELYPIVGTVYGILNGIVVLVAFYLCVRRPRES